ncbi:MAG: M42 family metallopeptidase [Tissierellia bacterium]|jgi:putative aminopeptidase FrvX|nr:M42 family metallopeptidase [Tissierellia bacterium]
MNAMKKQLQELLDIPSPIGYTKEATAYLKDKCQELGLDITSLNKGGFYATIAGKAKNALLINAHVDTLGAMVRELKSNGRIKLVALGGMPWGGVEGENLKIHTRSGKVYGGTLMPIKSSVHVHGNKVREELREPDSVEVRLDEFCSSKDDLVKLGINVGDFVSFDPRTRMLDNGFIKSRYLDDKSCCVLLLALAKKIKEEGVTPRKTIHLFFSNYEELGHGLYAIPQDVDESISVDIGCVGEGQTASEHKVTILAKDGKTPYDYDLISELVNLAEKNQIPYNIDAIENYGSDTSAALSQGKDMRFACLGPGVESTHHYERTHEDALQATLDLLYHYSI